jgi:hypothetical protein
MTATKLRPKNDSTASKASLKITISAETWRFIAYIFFWGMCAFAKAVSTIVVAPKLAEGPTAYGMEKGSTCGPFGPSDRSWDEEYVKKGEGFDIKTQTHLQMLFGFGNICTNWDYSPARELTAMVYPLFEYSLIIYIILDFVTTLLANKRGELNAWFWKFSKAAFVINLVLCAQFRMIFVCIAYDKVEQHTAGFLGLQIALILVAVQNSLFLIDTEVSYEYLGGIHKTRTAIKAYLIGLLAISLVKVSATIFVVGNGYGADWTMKDSGIGDMKVGQVVDLIWMLFNAVAPLIISYFRANNEIPLVIEVSTDAPNYIDEAQPLKKSSGGGNMKYEQVRYEAAASDVI